MCIMRVQGRSPASGGAKKVRSSPLGRGARRANEERGMAVLSGRDTERILQGLVNPTKRKLKNWSKAHGAREWGYTLPLRKVRESPR